MLADSVRASSADGPVRLSYLVALAFGESGTGNEVWINIAKAGNWEGHPRGPFQFTPQVFDQIVNNTTSRVTPINCDYEHQTFRNLTGAIPSAGRILKVERRGDELWALCELTDRAAAMVRSGEYRTCSPVIEFDSKDRVSGKDIGPELLSLALTNDPFQDGLHPIKLTRIAMADHAPPPPPPAAASDDEKKKKEQQAQGAACMSDAGGPPAAPAGGVTVTVTPQGGVTATPAGGNQANTVTLADPPAAAPADAAPADDSSVDANAVFDSIAQAAGVDKASVLGWLADNLDQLVNMIQAGVAQDGTVADNSKAMSRVAAAASDLRALKVELRVKDQTVEKLNSQVVALTARLEQVEKQHVDEKTATIKAHVLGLQKQGFVGPEQEHFDDAFFMFSTDYARASRLYSRQIVPIGLETTAERNPNAETGPVTMSNLTEKERARVEFMMRATIPEDVALQKISEQRAAGKGN